MSFKELVRKFIPDFLLSFYHYCLALIGAFLYGFPSRKLTVIGITGTSGKSTVVELSSKILEEAGFKVASLSSIKFKIGVQEWENKLKITMPGRFKIQRFLKRAVKAGCDLVVLEVTSEGIKQFRHKFIKFDVAVFTNLSPEHIESHGTFEKYRGAKLQLFKIAKVHIINLDDKNAKYFWEIPAKKKISYRLNEGAKLLPKNLNLLGEFNLYNALAAVHVGLLQGASLDICKRALEKVEGIPGRMEVVIKKPFTVIVDYAHTPEALEKVYKFLITNYKLQTNKLICVLGACGGGRDKWKRPVMGSLAHRYCREVIITNEDPYDENPLKIMGDIESGFLQIPNSLDPKGTPRRVAFQNPKYLKILNRREAIRKGISLARSGDVVVITGKGSELWMCVAGGKKIPWDDRKIVKEEYEKIRDIRA